ncbi:hypothetical protein Tco_1454008 [Tanacetum coccineum]
MAAPGPSNFVARRAVDDLIDFSGETVVPKFMKFFCPTAIGDQDEVFDTLICLRDDIHEENNKLLELNGYVKVMEAGMKVMKGVSCDVAVNVNFLSMMIKIVGNGVLGLWVAESVVQSLLCSFGLNRSLDYMREMVVRVSATLGGMEQLLDNTHVGMCLKAGYVADMDEVE